MKKLLVSSLFLIPLLSHSQRDWDAIEIKVIEVTENISYLEGSGGNIGVVHGDQGVMIIDDQFEQLAGKIQAAISSLTDGKLKFILNTHYHGDHTGGNAALSKNGATIMAHDNVYKRLSKGFYNKMRKTDVEPKSMEFWPDITVQDLKATFNGEEFQMVHVPAAHTDGDMVVFFPNSNVLHAGDAFVRYGYPYIDYSAGGTIDGIIDAQETILKLCNDDTKIIPGHGGLSSVSDVEELLNMLKETRKIVADLKDSGKTLDECISANPLADYHEKWSGSFINSDLFVQLIFETI